MRISCCVHGARRRVFGVIHFSWSSDGWRSVLQSPSGTGSLQECAARMCWARGACTNTQRDGRPFGKGPVNRPKVHARPRTVPFRLTLTTIEIRIIRGASVGRLPVRLSLRGGRLWTSAGPCDAPAAGAASEGLHAIWRVYSSKNRLARETVSADHRAHPPGIPTALLTGEFCLLP